MIDSNKPVQYYDPAKGADIAVMQRAFVYPIGRSEKSALNGVITTLVLEHDTATGVFETLNTVYKPIEVLLNR